MTATGSSNDIRELPAPPREVWRIIGPGVVAAGVGLSSGEFILWPYIASQSGLVFLWAAVVGVGTQFFLNMEIERYTLATGETALSGFNRFWRHWGLVFAAMVYFANLWPGWALSSATLATYIVGGDARILAAASLVVIGATLTLSPIVYTALERLVFVKVAAVAVLGLLALALVIEPASWRALPAGLFGGVWPADQSFALLMGALAFAGAGGGQNLCQSNWIRDKRFGMGVYVPRIVSPLTGVDEAQQARRYTFVVDAVSRKRWNAWWRFANIEQAMTFVLVTIVTICLTSMLAHSTLAGVPDLPNGIGFLQLEGERLQSIVAPWFGLLFWSVGAFSLFASSLGIVDYTSRLAADVLKNEYLSRSAITESVLYLRLVWGLVLIGCIILLAGVSQPLPLLVVSACVGGTMMCLYSVLLILLNRRELPPALRIRRFRVFALVWSAILFGVLAAVTIAQQLERQPARSAETPPRIERLDPALDRLIASDAKVEILAEGFDWSEGPVWVKSGGFLLFSDVPRNVVLRWKDGDGVREWLKPSGHTGDGPRTGEPGSNGLAIDSEGRLILAQHGDRRIARMEASMANPMPKFTTIADRFQGARFNSPNDLVFHSNGDVYFTDPPYGLAKQADDPARELPYQGVFRRAKNGSVTLVARDMTRPNGIAFSPDERRLYVSQSDPAASLWKVFDVSPDGTVVASRVFFDALALSKSRKGLPDGLKVDVEGNLFAAGPGGVLVLAPDGRHLGTILTGQATGNCAFGDDGRTLYITADMYLMRVRLKTKGLGF